MYWQVQCYVYLCQRLTFTLTLIACLEQPNAQNSNQLFFETPHNSSKTKRKKRFYLHKAKRPLCFQAMHNSYSMFSLIVKFFVIPRLEGRRPEPAFWSWRGAAVTPVEFKSAENLIPRIIRIQNPPWSWIRDSTSWGTPRGSSSESFETLHNSNNNPKPFLLPQCKKPKRIQTPSKLKGNAGKILIWIKPGPLLC